MRSPCIGETEMLRALFAQIPRVVMGRELADQPLAMHQRIKLCIVTLIALLPHLLHDPLWMGALSCLISGSILWLMKYRTRIWLEHQPTIQKFKIALVLLCLIGVLAQFRTLLGRDPGVALLCSLAALKLVEVSKRRDVYMCCYLAFFLCLTTLFFIQEILMMAYALATIACILLLLLDYNHPEVKGAPLAAIKPKAMLIGKYLLQALPLTALLFIVFPRFQGPLWGFPKDSRQGLTGISDSLSLGSFSELALSNAVAFRVEFFGNIPPSSKLYWRGPVMTNTNGVEWTADKNSPFYFRGLESAGATLNYTLTQEPTDQRWIFALEFPSTRPLGSYFNSLAELKTRSPLRIRQRFELQTHTQQTLPTLKSERSRALRLPEGKHPRTISLAQQWRNEYPDDMAFAQRALRHFSEELYFYTLKPGLMLGDPIDEFLFEKKRGFCEHYATAFTILMRAGGIPARVVTGYQGGEYNAVADYMIVRQYNAHAWTEISIDGVWTRVDPTAAVAPERIEQGMESSIPEELDSMPGAFRGNVFFAQLWLEIGQHLDAVNYRWSQWVLSYGRDQQQNFLSWLGFGKLKRFHLAIATVLSLALSFLAYAVWILMRQRSSMDPAQRLYHRFHQKIAGHNSSLSKQSHETPRSFAQRASAARPELRSDIETITNLYMDIRYGSQTEKFARLKKAIHKL
ncbi:MAG: transglutaminase TgpA family protein [Candidatus Eutrophobiaceae bacterium]